MPKFLEESEHFFVEGERRRVFWYNDRRGIVLPFWSIRKGRGWPACFMIPRLRLARSRGGRCGRSMAVSRVPILLFENTNLPSPPGRAAPRRGALRSAGL